jgi:hydroxymethylglutaryl-CoA lyase
MGSSTVRIYEVSPRDGLQNEATVVPTAAKLELVRRLVSAGVVDVEATSFVRPRWIPQLADAHELVLGLPRPLTVAGGGPANYWGLVPNRVGLERALEAGLRCVASFMSVSESHNMKNVNRTVRESLAGTEEVLAVARDEGMRTRSYLSTVFGCPYEGAVAPEATLDLARRLLDGGADEIVLGDTTGMGHPGLVERVIGTLVDGGLPLERLSVHFHDTRGTALANALTAWRLGITTFDASVGGLGGCPYAPGAAGNLATEDLVFMFDGLGVQTGIDLEALAEAGVYASEVLGRELGGRYHRAYVGERQRASRRSAAAAAST